MRIGHVDADQAIREAVRLAGLGGVAVPARPRDLTDLPESGPRHVTAVTTALAGTAGGQVVASGGTTGRLKVTVVAHHQGIPRLLRSWRPLDPAAVLLNLFRPGRIWGAHYYYHALAAHCRASVLPMGPLPAEEIPQWLDLLAGTGVNALAGPPSVLADFAEAVRATGVTLPVRTVVWVGEPMTPAREEAITRAFPGAEFWGNYGSIETYVAGINRPGCDRATMHLLPDQLLELDGDRTLLTRTGGGWATPVVRYRLGDRLRAADCRCGHPDAFEILGRADDRIKFHNTMIRAGEVLDVVRDIEGVADAQLVLAADPRDPAAARTITIRYVGPGRDGDAVRAAALRRMRALGAIVEHAPDALLVQRSSALDRNRRTGKVTPQIWRPDPAGNGSPPAPHAD